MNNRLIHAYVTDGKGCWHEWEWNPTYNEHHELNDPYVCKLCGITRFEIPSPPNPDYSTPDNFKRLTDKLFGDEKLFEYFWWHCYHINGCPAIDWDMARWLFSDYSRFCTLFADFLRLPNTIEEFGWTPYDSLPKCMYGKGNVCIDPNKSCEYKVLGQYSAWARLIQDEKDA